MDKKTVRRVLDNQATGSEARWVAEWLATPIGVCFLEEEIMRDLEEEDKK